MKPADATRGMHAQILALAVPNILSNVSVPLVSAVDTYLMGHQDSAHLAALGIVSMIFLFLYGTMNFLRMGTTGLTAQAFGRRDNAALSQTLYRALLVGLAVALALLLLQQPILEISFYLMNVDAGYRAYAQSYFELRIWTAPAVFMLYALTGWYFGMQNALYPLFITLTVNMLNILFSFYFVMVLGWGIEGAAYGTIIGQYGGLALGFILLVAYKRRLGLYRLTELLRPEALGAFLHVNRQIFVRTLSLTFIFAFFYAQAAKDGEATLTVMILLLQFIVWFSYSLDGFANAAESLTGRYYGAEAWETFHRAIRLLFAWGFGFTLLYMLAYGLFGEAIVRLYTDQEAIVNRTLPYLPYAVAMPLLGFAAFIWDGVFVGMTATRALKNAVLLSGALFLGLFYLTKGIDFAYALWINFLLFFFFRGAVQTWMFYRRGKRLR